MKYIISIFILLHLLTTQAVIAQPTANLKMVGQAKLTIFLWDIYQASLYSENGIYQVNVYPQALRVNYLRNIKSEELLETTQKEWHKFTIPKELEDKWLTLLADIFPDIKKGDSLLMFVDKDKRSTFFYNEKKIGQIADPDFAYQFLRIWLDKSCSYPEVCQQLRGKK